MDRIDKILYQTLRPVVNAYPVYADVEGHSQLEVPFAVFKINKKGDSTKDRKKCKYDIEIFMVCKSFDDAFDREERLEVELFKLRDYSYRVSTIDSTIDFDREDKKWVVQMNFTIKL